MSQKHLISIIGPTAIGKTSLAIAISQRFNAPIISSDSRQFYKEMTIGTAVPSISELSAAPHFFIQHKSINEFYSVGDFEKEAMSFLNDYFKTSNIAIVVGGSGLYTDALCDGLDNFPKIPHGIRERLNHRLKNEGLLALQEELKIADPFYFDKITIENPVRVIRALEVFIATGKPFSSYLNKPRPLRPFKVHTIGIEAPRAALYELINNRVDIMFSNGLLEEVKNLVPYKNFNALNTVGYKELFSYLNHEITLEKATEEIKKNSRRFAKRQATWNRKKQDVFWVHYLEAKEKSLSYLEALLS